MNFCEIKYPDVANGPGIRVSLFVSGCTHHCHGCFNPETWSFSAGQLFDRGVEDRIMDHLRLPYVNGLTLLGGEPFEPANQRALLSLIRRVKAELPGKTIWGYTGYVYDRDLVPGGRAFCEATSEILEALDVLVDGPFIEAMKDISLAFRGTRNQRIINLKKHPSGWSGGDQTKTH